MKTSKQILTPFEPRLKLTKGGADLVNATDLRGLMEKSKIFNNIKPYISY